MGRQGGASAKVFFVVQQVTGRWRAAAGSGGRAGGGVGVEMDEGARHAGSVPEEREEGVMRAAHLRPTALLGGVCGRLSPDPVGANILFFSAGLRI